MKKTLEKIVKYIFFGLTCTFAFSTVSVHYLKFKIESLDTFHSQWQLIWFGILSLCCLASFFVGKLIVNIVIARSKQNSNNDSKSKQAQKISLGLGGGASMLLIMSANKYLDLKGVAIFNIILFLFLMSISYFIFILYLKGKDIKNKNDVCYRGE